MATPLHVHTEKSALDGLSKPEEIADRIEELGMMSVAITDHDFVAGHIDFYKEMTKRETKPILGIETYQTAGPRQTPRAKALSITNEEGVKNRADNFHLILLAMNNTGLRNLWTLNSESHRTGFWYNGRADWELLEKYNEGIICTSACGLGIISQAIRNNPFLPDADKLVQKFLGIFGSRFYMELSTYSEDWQRNLNIQLVGLAKDHGVPLVYANDAHYAFPGQYELHETVLCMQYQEKLDDRVEPHHTHDLYIMSEDEMNKRFNYLPQSIVDECFENSDDIAFNCEVSLPEHKQHVPVFIPDKKWKSSRDMIFDLAVEGYEKKIAARGLPDDVYMKRFKSELDVIFRANLHDYLLIVRDFIVKAKQKGLLVGPGRGSIGGSLVAYLIDIHEIDPIRYGLIFERFYNEGRETSLPDIDVDFPTFSREFVQEYLAEKYGAEYCAQITNVNTLKGRAAIQKIGKTLGTPESDLKIISKTIERAIESGQQPKWEDIWKKVGDELQPYKTRHPKLFEYAETMYNRTFTYGVHASGFLVSDVPLSENFPLRWNTKDKKVVTQWDMRIAEELGYMKFDLLGLRNLDALMEFNKITDDPIDFYDVIRMDEDGELPEEMWELLDNGFTTGIFQIEDSGTPRHMCKQIRPRSLDDIATITALNRPGPLKSGSDRRYIAGRNGAPVQYIHPIFEKVAKETYGEIIYQEQFINFFIELGYDPKEADNIRAIVGKKKRDKMAEVKPDYMQRFMTQGADKTLAEDVWRALENFADYAFNKAHSVEYGLISLWTLYAKWKDVPAFILGSIRSLIGDEEHTKGKGKKNDAARFIREAKRLGIPVLPPDLNLSEANASIVDGSIRYGFADVKGIGQSPAKWLVNNRPFEDFDQVLIKAQEPERKMRLKNGTMIVGVKANQVKALRDLTELEGDELVAVEEELLGVALSDESATILEEYADEIAAECVPLEDIEEPGIYTVAGIITNVKETRTRRGDKMAWVTLASDNVEQDFTVWNTELERLHFIWRTRQAVVAQVKVSPAKDGNMYKNIMSAKALYTKKSKTTYATR